MIEIIRADLTNPKHAEALVNLMREYALDPMGGGKELPEKVLTNLAAELHKRQGAHVILAFKDKQAIGLVNCIEGFSTFACQPLLNIHDAIVTKAYRGQGILQKLFAEAEQIAKENGCCKLTLEVLEGNLSAQKAYLKFGFSGYELDPKMGKALFWEKGL